MKYGKKYADSIKAYDRNKQYEAGEAVGIVLDNAKAKFDETVELHVRLGIDPRQADQQVRSSFPTVRVKLTEYSLSQRARERTRRKRRAQITSAQRK